MTNKGGRPKKPIDMEMVSKLAMIHCTMEEIASFFDVHVDTLRNREGFLDVYKRGMDDGKKSLRRMQFTSAEKGNVTMQIWLGKQYLKQRDQVVDVNEEQERLDKIVDAIKSNLKSDV